ncbi:uncharacterized protein KY384_007059 [Bacidia gigantensis]|uniref:uncharacterized protein n=1 Tax=Bacidia gigantensis TaxID=2732470 RepID=UPI001D05572E|nr:uncharacterized protein KY384_007059 [Bacidia gigantensis]KAG8528143.1 hypothetical protein KY384_007059 [Bacidia gigantensis]
MDIKAVSGDQLVEKLTSFGMQKSRPVSEGSYDYVEKADSMDSPVKPTNRLALTTVAQHGTNVLTQRWAQIKDTQNFNVKISLEGSPITNQRSSGRCWLFAATNVFRVAIMKRYNLKEFELSQSYLFYWDKLEKANWFLEQVLDTIDEPLDGRLVQRLMEDPVGDGGQWDMVANLVEKYGLIPQQHYPDSYNAQNSNGMRALITTKLREDALELRQLATQSKDPRASLGSVKDKMLRDIHRILTVMLGPPPSANDEFTWEYHNKEDKFGSLTTTPLQFAGELSSKASIQSNTGVDIHEVFSLVNDPRNEYNRLLTVDRLGNAVGMRHICYVNVSMPIMKSACVAMLKADLPIFFGSDVGKYLSQQGGIMDIDLIDYELGFNVKLGLSKAQRLMTGESAMTHAMVLTAVHLDKDGEPVRWRVQNSWGETAGTKGWFVMADRWMDQFVYQAVVDPKYPTPFVSKEIRDILTQDPKVLPLWDPMGALA